MLTIANFRKDNSKTIRGVRRQFVLFCQQLELFGENLVAIDGRKFKAVNNRDRNFTYPPTSLARCGRLDKAQLRNRAMAADSPV